MTEYSLLLYYILPLVGLAITIISQIYVSMTYKRYKQEGTKNRLSGFDVARKILDANGLKDIHVVEVTGNLTDHYDPSRKVIRLSSDIFHGSTIASNAVAAHECGHAIQDKDGYVFMRIRAALVPVVNLSSKLGYLVIVIGLIAGIFKIALAGLILLLALLLFQLITLPVEFDASNRAKKELDKLNILNDDELDGSNTMLRAAAFTYVASLVTTFFEILRLAFMVFGNRD